MGLAAVPRPTSCAFERARDRRARRLDDEHVCGHPPTPGMLVKMSNRWHRSESALRSVSASIDRFDLPSIWRSLDELTLDEGETAMAWRLRAATRSLMSASRALTSSSRPRPSCWRGRVSEVENRTMRASIRASHRSVPMEFSCPGEASGLTGVDLGPKASRSTSACWNRRW